jgi:hypothetical protein
MKSWKQCRRPKPLCRSKEGKETSHREKVVTGV